MNLGKGESKQIKRKKFSFYPASQRKSFLSPKRRCTTGKEKTQHQSWDIVKILAKVHKAKHVATEYLPGAKSRSFVHNGKSCGEDKETKRTTSRKEADKDNIVLEIVLILLKVSGSFQSVIGLGP